MTRIGGRLLIALLVGALVVALAPAPQAFARQVSAVVTCSSDDVHTQPSIYAPVLATYYAGQTVALAGAHDRSQTWTLVRTAQGAIGYMKSVCLDSSAGGTVVPTGATVRVATGKLNVRTGPWVSFPVIAKFPGGTVLSVVGRNATGTWVQVAIPGGAVGWLNSFYTWLSVPLTTLPIVAAPPSPTPIPTQPTTAYIRHVVQPGETLFLIGLRYGVSWTRIAALNNLANPNLIYAGQVLLIPSS